MATPSGDAGVGPASLPPLPTVVIVIGMAGSGKTALLQRMNSYLRSLDQPGAAAAGGAAAAAAGAPGSAPYIVNLDPAVLEVGVSGGWVVCGGDRRRRAPVCSDGGPVGLDCLHSFPPPALSSRPAWIRNASACLAK